MSDTPETNGALQLADRPEAVMRSDAPLTPRESREVAVAELLKVAMSKAGALQLTKEESTALMADFPDDAFRPGAAGKENLIYLEHSHLRDRLNNVLGLGQWAVVVREHWAEDTNKGHRIYVRAMLIVRGCYVAEAVGDMDYYLNNASQNFGDAFEGATTAAFRRCCKQFGIGVQAWNKVWCEGWWARKRGQQTAKPAQQSPQQAASPPPDPLKPIADLLASDPTLDKLNAEIPRLIGILAHEPKKIAWARVTDWAKRHGVEWDAQGKSFVKPKVRT